MSTTEEQWLTNEERTDALINKLDAFLLKMQDLSDRLLAKLDEKDEISNGTTES